ncbi:hypothetical protein BJX66DRAFT_339771 [Aspergillus keveii]|uniref:Uncharacterized protein n=1 Tax=Aspergillus keveii TaxID=714993 RepID=A0ABR4G0F3_9EURO
MSQEADNWGFDNGSAEAEWSQKPGNGSKEQGTAEDMNSTQSWGFSAAVGNSRVESNRGGNISSRIDGTIICP